MKWFYLMSTSIFLSSVVHFITLLVYVYLFWGILGIVGAILLPGISSIVVFFLVWLITGSYLNFYSYTLFFAALILLSAWLVLPYVILDDEDLPRED